MFHYPHSVGMCFEAQAVTDCLRRGETECPEMTLDETLKVMEVCDAARAQLGVKWPHE